MDKKATDKKELEKTLKALAELKELADATKAFADKMGEALEESEALGIFNMKKAAEYFNEAAQTKPESRAEYLAKSALFRDAAKINTELSQAPDRDLTAREESVLRMVEAWGESSKAEVKAVEDYAMSRMSEFIAENPLLWERIAKNNPGMAEKVKQAAPKPKNP